MERVSPFLERISESGLNVAGIADPLAWDAQMPPARRTEVLFPGTQSILVIGSGAALWDAFIEDLRKEPKHLTRERHPLDAFVRRTVESADSMLGAVPRRWFFAGTEANIHLNFQVLAELAGLGHRSRMGLLLHPQLGPWMGLRAACFIHVPLQMSRLPAKDFCSECEGFCEKACPGQAFEKGSWKVDLCSDYRALKEGCVTCASRQACPVGASHRYSEDALRYHYDSITFRHELREKVGIKKEDDTVALPRSPWQDWQSQSSQRRRQGVA